LAYNIITMNFSAISVNSQYYNEMKNYDAIGRNRKERKNKKKFVIDMIKKNIYRINKQRI